MSMLNRLCVCFLFFASPLFGDYISLGKFSLSRTELRNAEYCEFLNAVAREGDPFCLWNPLMTDSIWGGDCQDPVSARLTVLPKRRICGQASDSVVMDICGALLQLVVLWKT